MATRLGGWRRWGAVSRGLLAAASFTMMMSGCASEARVSTNATALDDSAVTIGSFNFVESEVLAEIYAVALEQQGFEVERILGVGPRELVQPALAAGLLEFVPEYSGAALGFLNPDESASESDVEATHAALNQALTGGPIVALAPSPAEDANAFVVTRKTADRYALTAISDLEGVAKNLSFGGPPECPTRPFCLLGLEKVYGLTFASFVALDAGGPLTHQALQQGYVDVALLFTTDPHLIGRDLVALTDDRGLQPAENVTPVVRRELLDRWGFEFEEVVNRVSKELTTPELRELNARVAGGIDPSRAAREWLSSQENRS